MKPITYAQLKQIQRMTLNAFNRWLTELSETLYIDGLQDGKSEFDNCVILTEERLMELLLSIKGIGKTRAEQIVAAIIEDGESNEHKSG